MNLGPGHRQPSDRPDLTIVVATHEGALEWLGECITGILAQDAPTVPEIVIVFDGPAPKARELVRAMAPAARQVALNRTRGFAGAIDEGVRVARGSLITLLNDDAVLQPGWITAMLEAAQDDPDAGSFASRVLQADSPETLDSAGHGLTRWGEPFAIGAGCSDGPPYDVRRRVFGAPATACVLRRELVRDCGGLDRDMEAYLEDVDLSLRAQTLGFPCLYVPAAEVHHRGSASYGWGPEGTGRAERLVSRNRVHILLKSMPRSTLRTAGPVAVASFLLDVGHRSLTGRHAGATAKGIWEGLQGAKASLATRPAALGRRRVDDDWMRDVLRESELDLQQLALDDQSGRFRSSRARLSRLMTAWVDRRERRIALPSF